MRVEDWTMLKLHKNSLIPSSVSITKKITQQYVGSFQIVKKVGWLAYKFKILSDWKIHPIFSVTQLEPAPDHQRIRSTAPVYNNPPWCL